ncbi:hypothetical protein CDL15_Pgr020066 [Punica granatum]|uniref:Uncharacterized protein n=1 Tax=Punica granatum TaxID=22663 RepID=A0A218VS89_PUNGR|nr:hypothetical protein CDL15_Pgr020066 [Punica granatum]
MAAETILKSNLTSLSAIQCSWLYKIAILPQERLTSSFEKPLVIHQFVFDLIMSNIRTPS